MSSIPSVVTAPIVAVTGRSGMAAAACRRSTVPTRSFVDPRQIEAVDQLTQSTLSNLTEITITIMSILGAIIRSRIGSVADVAQRLQSCVGVDLALNPGDGRLVIVLEDCDVDGLVKTAAEQLAAIALWPEVLNTSLVYEYSGPDSPAPAGAEGVDFKAWRRSLAEIAGQAAGPT
jgi:periplasmic nitrate reductase NapD